MSTGDLIYIVIIILLSSVITYQIGKWVSKQLKWE